MANSRASIRNGPLLLVLGGIALPACGQAPAHHPIRDKGNPMASTSTNTTATDLAANAKAALDAGDAKRANTLYDQAIAAIGTSYRREGTIDDTGMKLTLATAEADRGNFDTAAAMKARVAESRLAQAATPR